MRIHPSRERQAPTTFVIEPWAEDYTILPGDELEIIPGSNLHIEDIDLEPDCVQIWLANKATDQGLCSDEEPFRVLVNGRAAKCGHGREHTDGRWG